MSSIFKPLVSFEFCNLFLHRPDVFRYQVKLKLRVLVLAEHLEFLLQGGPFLIQGGQRAPHLSSVRRGAAVSSGLPCRRLLGWGLFWLLLGGGPRDFGRLWLHWPLFVARIGGEGEVVRLLGPIGFTEVWPSPLLWKPVMVRLLRRLPPLDVAIELVHVQWLVRRVAASDLAPLRPLLCGLLIHDLGLDREGILSSHALAMVTHSTLIVHLLWNTVASRVTAPLWRCVHVLGLTLRSVQAGKVLVIHFAKRW